MDSPRLLQLTVRAEEEYMRCRYTGKVNKLIILFPAIAGAAHADARLS